MLIVVGPQLFHVCQAWVKPDSATAGEMGVSSIGVALGVGVTAGVDVGAGVAVEITGLKAVAEGCGVSVGAGVVASSSSREIAELGRGVGMMAVGRRALSSVRMRRGSAEIRLRAG